MTSLEGVWSATVQQQIFRALVTAMSSPGEVVHISVNGTRRTAVAVLAALLDNSVTLCDYDGTLDELTLRFLQATSARCEEANYVLAAAGKDPSNNFSISLGELAAPEAGATLILEGGRIQASPVAETASGGDFDGSGDFCLEISGPGVNGVKMIELGGFRDQWFHRRAEWVEDFPLGVDLLLVDADSLVCIPRSSAVVLGGSWATLR
jgi:alpha-D-ribose 1-methylphosphonate 5-triphosphate synthase subunit PhnH